MSEITLDYLAGFIDGEGSFSIYKAKKRKVEKIAIQFTVQIANTNLEILKMIQNQYGGKIYLLKRKNKSWKPIWKLMWTGEKAISISILIKDKLIVRKKQAELMASIVRPENFTRWHPMYQDYRMQREKAIIELNKLNRRGNEVLIN